MISLLFYALLGIVAGTFAGLLGVGGGVFVVPGLAWIFTYIHMPKTVVMHMAISTSLAGMILTTLASVIAQQKHGAIRWNTFRKLAPGMVLGLVLGVYIASVLSTHILSILFAIFLLITAIRMLQPNKKETKPLAETQLNLIFAGIAIGISSGMLGIGGGALAVPLLNRFGLPMRNATATSSACACLLAMIGTICFAIVSWHISALPAWSSGYVYWPAALAVSIPSMFLAPLGAYWAHKLPELTLKRIFAVILLLIVIEMIIP